MRHARCFDRQWALVMVFYLVGFASCVFVEAAPGYVSTSVLNMTFTGASTGWPTSTSGLATASEAVTSAVCTAIPSTVAACSAFLMFVSSGVVALQMSVDTDIAANASSVYMTLYAWSQNTGSPPTQLIQTAAQSALGTTLSTLSYESGAYSMPCRGDGVYSFLPVCSASEVQPNTTFYVRRTSGNSGDVSTSIKTYLCALQTSCTDAVVTVTEPSGSETFARVTITDAAMALEAILAYVSAVRTATTTTQTDVLRIEMRSGSMTAPLFSINETSRYEDPYPVTLQCAPATGMWAIALVAIVPIALIMFRYIWYRGRKHAKKVGRQRVIEDEQRIMQGYTTGPAASTAGATADPPPGMDASAYVNSRQQTQGGDLAGTGMGTAPAAAAATTAAQQDQQWVMDEQGNYYLMSAEEAAAATGGDSAGTDQDAGQAATASGVYPGVESVEMDHLDPGENSISYQTYVDPETGETYQYVVDPQAAEAAAQEGQEVDPNAVAEAQYAPQEASEEVAVDAEADPQSTAQYVQYVDPATGETYYYDANATQEEAAVPE